MSPSMTLYLHCCKVCRESIYSSVKQMLAWLNIHLQAEAGQHASKCHIMAMQRVYSASHKHDVAGNT